MTPDGIRRRYYLLNGSFTLAASLIWGVNTLFLLDSGLDLLQVFGVNAVFTAAMALFEIPTGALADSRGRRKSLQWSAVMLLVGTLGYLAAGTWNGGVPAFAAASVVLGLGFTFFSGAAEAWVVDELKAAGAQDGTTRLFASAATASSVMMLLGTVAGGFLGSADYRIPYILRAVLFLLMLYLTIFAMPERGWKPDGEALSARERIRRTASDSVRYGLKSPALRGLMGLSLIIGTFMMWGFYALQPYITDLAGYPGAAWLSGLVTAFLTVAQVGGQTLAARKDREIRTGGFLAGAMAAAAAGAVITGVAGFGEIRSALGMPWAPIMAFSGMMLMIGSLGYAAPFQQTALHKRIPSEKRATVVSVNSLAGSLGAIGGQPALGWTADRFGISVGYFAGAGLFLLAQPVLRTFRRSERDEGEDA